MAGRQGRQHRAHAEDARPAGDRDRLRGRRRPARASSSSSPRSRSSTTSCASARSRARTPSVLDPTTGEQTEINERGPAVSAQRGRAVPRQAALPRARRGDRACSPARCRAGVEPDLYAEPDPRAAQGSDVTTVVDTDGEPLRHAVRAEPDVVSPNVLEAEELVGHEFNDDEDRADRRRARSSSSAPREAIMTLPDGCFAQRARRRPAPRSTACAIEPREAVARRRLGRRVPGRLRRRALRGPPADECLRFGVACGAESTAAPRRRPDRPARGRAAAGRGRRATLGAGRGR